MAPEWIEGGRGQAADAGGAKPFPTRTILELLFCFGKGWKKTNLIQM